MSQKSLKLEKFMEKNDLQALEQRFASKTLTQLGPYRIEKEIGAGGMGKVYKAYHLKMKRHVALKTFLPGEKITPQQKRRFLQEARTMARVRHPGIITIYDIAQDQDIDYLVMDFIDGKDLSFYIEQRQWSIRQSLETIVDVALAIDHIHQNGIVHRDLKPNNLMVENNSGKVIVMDFGLAKLEGENITQSGEVMGTPRYMPPEQIEGKKITPATDVYALGAILYELLAYAPAIKGNNPINMMFNAMHVEPISLCSCNQKLAKELEIICHKAMSKKAKYRYFSAKGFADDIQRFLNGEVILASPPSFGVRVKNKIKRNKLYIIASAIGLAVLIVSLTMANFYWKQEAYQKAEKLLTQANILEQEASSFKRDIHSYLKISNYIEKALSLVPHDVRIKERFLLTQLDIVHWALEHNEFLIGYATCNKIQRLGYIDKIQKLRESLRKKQNQGKKQQLDYITKAMGKISLTTSLVQKQWLVTKIVRMKGQHVVIYLISFLKSANSLQRKIAIQTLGRIGDTHTKIDDKDTVEWLLELLAKTNPHHNPEEVHDLIWALGHLRDPRANAMVEQKRWQAQENDAFWQNTRFAYRLLPDISQKIYSASDNKAKELLRQGIMRTEKNDFVGAMEKFNKAIAIDPNFAEAYNNRAMIYVKKNNLQKAIEDFNTALKLGYEDNIIHVNRSAARLAIGDIKGALQDLDMAIKGDPQNDIAYGNRARIYTDIGKPGKAVKDLSRAIAIKPQRALFYLNRGLAYGRMNRFQEAMNDYHQAIEIDPKMGHAYFYRGFGYYHLRQKRRALADYSKAIRLNPRHIEAYLMRGRIRLELRDAKKALEDYDTIIKLDSKHVEALYHRAYALDLMKETKKAIVAYTKTIKTAPSYSRSYISRGYAILRFGTKSSPKYAIKDFRKFLQLEPYTPHRQKLLKLIKKLNKKKKNSKK